MRRIAKLVRLNEFVKEERIGWMVGMLTEALFQMVDEVIKRDVC